MRAGKLRDVRRLGVLEDWLHFLQCFKVRVGAWCGRGVVCVQFPLPLTRIRT